MQNTRMIGISTLRGMRRMRADALMQAQPSGSISRLARMNTMNTA